MTAPIRSLKFDKRPMCAVRFGFWAQFVALGNYHTLEIHRATDATKCHWKFTTNGKVTVVHAASGVIAARNAAQRWFDDERDVRPAIHAVRAKWRAA